ncbi:NHL domain-containing protein [Thiohalomonas denitrificans]|uniref:NHL domain-containing protein n=1 Tax=Thiohalomonas denitrificans TaxID=415747 RepID=UPI0026EC3EB0|nr:RHS repeat-associated core domain-containing protein [Thiohalomonas denitrificans]
MGSKRTLPWITTLALLSFGILSSAISGSFSSDSHVDAVWIGHTGGTLKIASADGELLFEIPNPDGIDSVAVDGESGRLWAASHGRVTAWSPYGEKLYSTLLPQGKRERSELLLAPDSRQKALWVARHDVLYWIDASGALEQVQSFRQPVTALALDENDGRLWVATRAELSIYETISSNLSSGIYKGKQPLQALAFAPSQGELWAADQRRLYRFDDQGRKTFELKLNGIIHIAADGEDGVWVADRKRVYRMDRSGLIRSDSAPFQGRTGTLIALDADRSDQTVWIASQSRIAQLSPDGAVVRELPLDAISSGRQMRALAVYADTIAPEVTITAPVSGAYLNENTPALAIEYSDVGVGVDPQTLQIEVDDSAVAVECDAQLETAACKIVEPLREGPISFAAKMDDRSGNTGISEPVAITIDTIPPEITVSAPKNGSYTNDPQLGLSGLLSEAAKLTVNGDPVSLQSDHSFSFTTELEEGANTFDILAIDYAGNRGEVRLDVILDTQPPQVVAVNSVTVEFEGDEAIVTGLAGSAEPGTTVTVTNTRTGESVTVTVGEDGSFTMAIAAEPGDVLEIRVVDRAGNSSDETRLDTGNDQPEPGPGFVPPDPATTAPPLSPTGPTSLAAATEFLYTGNNRIQFDVESGTIQDYRAAVLRGRVTDRNGEPLSGVTITVHDHPEFGWTGTRADGLFDLVVNGGGLLTVNYKKEGYLPVQRKIDTPWEDYTWLPDVVMIPLDTKVTTIDLTSPAPIQIAQGNVITDKDGSRQATLLFPQGVQAQMVLPDGTTQSLTTMNVRATEYTVGTEGPKTMPGALPPTSGYTYAVELSVDEAVAAGAKEVRFDRVVPFYVDNFLDFPTGEIVPVGWYDYDKAAWIPSQNGRVIKILSINNGLAEIDIEGSGDPATTASLAALGITNAERTRLAELYSPGHSLWRSPIRHFTPYDCNWGYWVPDDAVPPDNEPPKTKDDNKLDDPNISCGCIIEAENQVLGESLPINGTPYTLTYRSDRTPGYRAMRTVKIPLSGETVPNSLDRIAVFITVAGQRINQVFKPLPYQQTTVVWNGRDGYGRKVLGGAEMNIRVSYIYKTSYAAALAGGGGTFVFGEPGGGGVLNPKSREIELVYSQDFSVPAASSIAGVNGLGFWSLSPHHTHSVTDGTLYRGDGTRAGAPSLQLRIAAVAGGGDPKSPASSAPATDAWLQAPWGVAVAPDGSIYFSETSSNIVRRVTPDRRIHTVTTGPLAAPTGVALGPDGSLYIADLRNHRIRRVGQDGRISTVAGGNFGGYSGDGGPAVSSSLHSPRGVAVGADGTLYIADTGNRRIRKVTPNGIITTVAGTSYSIPYNGAPTYNGDGGAAKEAWLSMPTDVAVGPGGSIYFSDSGNYRIRRVGVDGTISTVAGNGQEGYTGYSGDGIAATEAPLFVPRGLTIDADGSVYFTEYTDDYLWAQASVYGNRVRRVGPDGIINTIAGNGISLTNLNLSRNTPFEDDGKTAVDVSLDSPKGVAIGPDGGIYIAASGNGRILKISSEATAIEGGRYLVPSQAGSEYYLLDILGRHYETIDSITGAVLQTFSYNKKSRLIGIKDSNENTTEIEYDSSSEPVAIVAPNGQRTELTLDEHGYLAAVSDPAGESHSMSYTAGGLLTSMTKPSGAQSIYDYDQVGRLIRDEDPVDGGWSLVRTESGKSLEVSMTSGEGHTSRYSVERLNETKLLRASQGTDGAKSTRSITTSASEITEVATSADGTVSTLRKAPDPRVGMRAPYLDAATVSTPAGLKQTISATREVTLSDPENLLSLTEWSESSTVNGRNATTVFDAENRVWTKTSAQGRTSLVEVNVQGRPVLAQTEGLAAVSYEYDSRGRLRTLTEDGGDGPRTVALTYDPLGNLETVTDALERTSRFEYDLAGRVTKQTLPDGREIGYQYDANGNLTALTPPGREAHVFAYTPVDLEEQYTPPDLEGVETVTRYAYNKDKDLTRIDRPDGSAVQLGYNAGGKLTSLTYPEGRLDYTYHPGTGQLSAITRADGGRLDYTWDGFLPLAETSTGEVSGTVRRTWDNNFWLTGLSVDGNQVTYGYDDDGLLTRAGTLSLNRNAQNGLLSATAIDSIETSRTWNTFSELQTETVTLDGQPVMTVEYTRDKLGRISEKRETTDGSTTTYAYSYDTAGRLETVRENGILTATYTYDQNGNRLSKATLNGTEEGAYDAQDRMVSYAGASYEYTENGDLKAKTENGATTGYTYDALGNLLNVTFDSPLPPGEGQGEGIEQIGYVIDGKNRRIGKKVNGQLVQGFLYQDQLNPIAELDGDGNIDARFVYGSKSNVPDYMEKDGATYRIVSDHLGSPRLVIDTASGDVAQRMAYDEFGNVVEDTNPGFQPFGFAGGIYDQHTGLVRFGARDYDSKAGRWTSKDLLGFWGSRSNLYGYVLNDAINSIDPFGLIDFYQPTRGENAALPPTSNCAIVGDCRERLDKYIEKINEPINQRPKKDESSDKKAKGKVLDKLKNLRDEITKDMICATMNSRRCDGDSSQPIWPPELEEEKVDKCGN